MKVLGIDPGIERLGWGVLEKNRKEFLYIDSGVKKTLKTKTQSARLWEIFKFLDETIPKFKPDMIATEKLFFSKNVKTAMIIGEVRGIILAVAEKHQIPLVEFAPMEAKIAVSGNGRADKKEVAAMLQFSVKIPVRGMIDDETDALALALTALVQKMY